MTPSGKSIMDSILELKPLIRAGVNNANGRFKSELRFLDSGVDGQSLWETLGKKGDQVSILCVEYAAEETTRAVGLLLLREKAHICQTIGFPCSYALSAVTWDAEQ